ncbi:MAG: hypothetical protein HZB16_24475 [Armatimonadetes bacterium]|nr:hypothetical protein [Armatimonadota bacterium]
MGKLAATVSLHALSPTSAQFRISGWDADGIVTISEDPETGDVLVEPSAYSSRPGLLSVRWRVDGVRDDLQLVAPFFQGTRLPLGDPLLVRRWFWPHFWEAGLAILEGEGSGFWIHCRDRAYRYKALNIEGRELGFETEAYGPIDTSLGAGGLVWRINVFEGDWRRPASIYRDWLWSAYHLDEQQALRCAWHQDIRFAVSWYNGNPDVLDALAEKLDPRSVLLHYSQWRTDAYDENYPTFTPSEQGKAVIAKANAMGFHIMPHANSVDMDPSHPAYAYLREFEYRDVATRRRLGWGWDPVAGGVLGVPNSSHNLADNRARKVMVKIHPGLAMWRSILCEEIARALEQAPNDAIFIDVTLCSHNLHQCLVENTTSSEGMDRLIRQIQGLGGGLTVGGEGINEVTMQGLSFAQAHLFNSWHATADGLARAGGAALGDFLWGKLCRAFGYSGLSGANQESEVRMGLHEQLGAIPTITIGGPDDIRQPNKAVAAAMERAR